MWWFCAFLMSLVGDPDFSHYTLDCDDDDSEVVKSLVNEFDYVGNKLSTDVRVPGRIGNKKFYKFWKEELKASSFILSTISEGYRFLLVSIPPPGLHKNNKSMLKERDFALTELLRLEQLGCISRVVARPYLCLPLSVVFSKKLR